MHAAFYLLGKTNTAIVTQDKLKQMKGLLSREQCSKKKEITCYKCMKASHYENECEVDEETVKTSNKKGLTFPST